MNVQINTLKNLTFIIALLGLLRHDLHAFHVAYKGRDPVGHVHLAQVPEIPGALQAHARVRHGRQIQRTSREPVFVGALLAVKPEFS